MNSQSLKCRNILHLSNKLTIDIFDQSLLIVNPGGAESQQRGGNRVLAHQRCGGQGLRGTGSPSLVNRDALLSKVPQRHQIPQFVYCTTAKSAGLLDLRTAAYTVLKRVAI